MSTPTEVADDMTVELLIPAGVVDWEAVARDEASSEIVDDFRDALEQALLAGLRHFAEQHPETAFAIRVDGTEVTP
jgi:hypothetical protein